MGELIRDDLAKKADESDIENTNNNVHLQFVEQEKKIILNDKNIQVQLAKHGKVISKLLPKN